jgi:hypothetical protein
VEEQLFRMLVYFETGAITALDIVQWAMNQVVNGNESDSINELASLTRSEKDQVGLLLKQAIKDIGFVYPTAKSIGIYRAKLVSEAIIYGKIGPAKGCSIIGSICSELEWPVILADFGLLCHQLTGHENLGITEKELREDIICSARKLIGEVNTYLNLK